MAGALVQSVNEENVNNDPSLQLTGVAAGNALIIVCGYGNGNTVTSVSTDNPSDPTNFTEGPTEETNSWNRVTIWYLENVASGTHNVTIDLTSTGNYNKTWLAEYSGLATSSMLDASNQGWAYNTSVSSGNVVTSDTCTLIGAGSHNDSGSPEQSHSLTGSSEVYEDNTTNFTPLSVCESTGLAASTYANTYSHAGNTEYLSTVLAAFVEAAAGGLSIPVASYHYRHNIGCN